MPVTNVARCVILNDENHILLVRRSPSNHSRVGLWEMVGGTEDSTDSDTVTALNREINEEISSELTTLSDVVYEADVTSPEAASQNRTHLLLVYVGRIANSEIILSDEHDAYTWSPQHDVFSYQLTAESEAALRTILPTLMVID